MLAGIDDYSTIRKGIFRSTQSFIVCQLVDKVALSAYRCRVQVRNRHCRIINYINIMSLSFCRYPLQVCEAALFYYFCPENNCGVGAQLEGIGWSAVFFLSPVGCWCRLLGVDCGLCLSVVLYLFVVVCRVSALKC